MELCQQKIPLHLQACDEVLCVVMDKVSRPILLAATTHQNCSRYEGNSQEGATNPFEVGGLAYS